MFVLDDVTIKEPQENLFIFLNPFICFYEGFRWGKHSVCHNKGGCRFFPCHSRDCSGMDWNKRSSKVIRYMIKLWTVDLEKRKRNGKLIIPKRIEKNKNQKMKSCVKVSLRQRLWQIIKFFWFIFKMIFFNHWNNIHRRKNDRTFTTFAWNIRNNSSKIWK